jgi:hypothetical protein
LWVGQNNQATWGSNVESFGDRLVESTRAAIAGVDKYLILAAPIADTNNNHKITNFKSIYEKMSYAFGAHYVNVAE